MLRTLIIQIIIYSFSTPKAWGFENYFLSNAFSCEGIRITKEHVLDLVRENEGTLEINKLKKDLMDAQNDDEMIELAEITSIKLYSDLLYKKINPPLREYTLPQGYINTVYSICSGLNKLPDYIGEVYRVSDLSQNVIDNFTEGKEVQIKAFLSTSASKAGIKTFRENTNKKINVVFRIQSRHGKDISHLSAWPKEEEILFPVGSRFLVRKISKPFYSKYTFIRMEEI